MLYVDFPMNSLRVRPLGHLCCERTGMMFACYQLILLYISDELLVARYSIHLRIWKYCDLIVGEHVLCMWLCGRDLVFDTGCFFRNELLCIYFASVLSLLFVVLGRY